MFAQLPELLKKEVLYYLQLNDFPKAKAIHDAWLETNNPTNPAENMLLSDETG